MTTWTRSTLLDLWERGASRHALDRALLLAASVDEGRAVETLADEPLAVRDQRLLAVLLENIGREIAAWVDCPACATRLEFTLDARTLVDDARAEDLAIEGRRLRRPTSRDLAVAMTEPDEVSQARRLAARCLGADAHGDASADLSDALIEQAERALAEAEAGGDLQLDFTCAACGHAWQDAFDIADYLWREVDTRARQLLRDVDVLARVYGWSERDVLALSETRRAAYVEMVTA